MRVYVYVCACVCVFVCVCICVFVVCVRACRSDASATGKSVLKESKPTTPT